MSSSPSATACAPLSATLAPDPGETAVDVPERYAVTLPGNPGGHAPPEVVIVHAVVSAAQSRVPRWARLRFLGGCARCAKKGWGARAVVRSRGPPLVAD
ncbi:DUF6296 family protein [Kitasatospora sp. NPDC001660]